MSHMISGLLSISEIHVYKGPMHLRAFTSDDKAVGSIAKLGAQVDKVVVRDETA